VVGRAVGAKVSEKRRIDSAPRIGVGELGVWGGQWVGGLVLNSREVGGVGLCMSVRNRSGLLWAN
jgi:hypothetical protein